MGGAIRKLSLAGRVGLHAVGGSLTTCASAAGPPRPPRPRRIYVALAEASGPARAKRRSGGNPWWFV